MHTVQLLCLCAEKLEAEFGERLLRLGAKATSTTLAALLAETVAGSASMAHPSSAARTAHVLIIAALNLVRVEVAPLPGPHDLPPLAFLLAQQQVMLLFHIDMQPYNPCPSSGHCRLGSVYCTLLMI